MSHYQTSLERFIAASTMLAAKAERDERARLASERAERDKARAAWEREQKAAVERYRLTEAARAEDRRRWSGLRLTGLTYLIALHHGWSQDDCTEGDEWADEHDWPCDTARLILDHDSTQEGA